MATTDSDQPIGFEEFRRYARGEMSLREQYDLEKRLLADPMAAEAYEGFLAMGATDAERIRTELKIGLNAKVASSRKRIIPLWTYAAAASVIVGLGVSWMILKTDNTNIDNREISAAIQAESPTIRPAEEKGEETQPLAKPAPSIHADQIAANVPGKKSFPAAAPVKELPESKSFSRLAEADEVEEALAVAEPGQSAFQAAPPAISAPQAAFSEPLAADKQSVSRARKLNDSTSIPTAAAAPAASKDTAGGTMPVPQIGWRSYRSYLNRNTQSSFSKGNVTVSFVVNSDSSLSGFTGHGEKVLLDQAIEIVKKGPGWKPVFRNGAPATAPVKVQIEFRSPN
ncbi:hypothetical protein [Dyadobacter sp. CY323]|uniref:hypothetical protein n=1 Tax=Dyadobacter sp. CY323 TaxID=2907302 RepID=UPI001F3DCD71|nr:hypothetical protein [Dyadobacter sp. CY323]MCE6987633.1 hypothetical protein [Dyadobacter sp. CY323]